MTIPVEGDGGGDIMFIPGKFGALRVSEDLMVLPSSNATDRTLVTCGSISPGCDCDEGVDGDQLAGLVGRDEAPKYLT